ncbi:UDP-N-acetylmuramoyl-L-alanine--D-glutamate ligase [Patescibacteria group bacterium]|nr:UDP-N-acetylmuramoyl-L-alanine--D-glutamate ligase [Patescibacteria group bacterium]MBU1956334.1 UDP-N-acetylmuramoyl-L-alanine--D-glutamate ligase [Patescibacteria group bacterium]
MSPKEYLKNKKVLVMGLGGFGGGIASAKWLLANGARVTITDLKNEVALKKSLASFSVRQRKNITFVLGRHRKIDFKTNDLIIVNPDVPQTSPFLEIARKYNKELQNDSSLFFQFTKSPTVAVTGTRGKTTTTNWIAQILSHHFGKMEPIGNSTKNPLLQNLKNNHTGNTHTAKKPFVIELSSWQLELALRAERAPHIAVITNLYPDHLNRHKTMEEYAGAKANIFANQNQENFLILNYNNPWTKFFLNKKPKAQVFFFSTKILPKNVNGVFVNDDKIIFQNNGAQKTIAPVVGFEKKWGQHNLANLLTSALAVTLYDPSIHITRKVVQSLTEIYLRQETVYEDKNLLVINDSASTSPDALISAVLRFGQKNLDKKHTSVFICGGTRKNLPFDKVTKILKQNVMPQNLIFLSGTATDDLICELKKINYFKQTPQVFDTLKECWIYALKLTGFTSKTVVFSPGAASFEKFKNEFDRGEQFNKLVEKLK